MKKFVVFIIVFFNVFVTIAQSDPMAPVFGVKFGTPYDEALKEFEQKIGIAETNDNKNWITFKDVYYGGYHWSSVHVQFSLVEGANVYSRILFIEKEKSKIQARKVAKELAEKIREMYAERYDDDDKYRIETDFAYNKYKEESVTIKIYKDMFSTDNVKISYWMPLYGILIDIVKLKEEKCIRLMYQSNYYEQNDETF